ncbi:GNAT family acetyltransferase [Okibacterium fritillariae]|uniref:GNAT family acetyltransferase n=1 Tax=Okibacterium fritillariae TaxID=123320 RepID=UPI00405577CC
MSERNSAAAAVTIRPLGLEQSAAATRLWEEAGLTRPWNPPAEDFARAVGGETSAVLGAFDGDELVGTAMVGHDGHRGWIYYLAVAETRRGSGLGRQLNDAAEEWMRERDVPKVQLMVRSTNAGVVDFYERLGYEDGEVVVLGKWLR